MRGKPLVELPKNNGDPEGRWLNPESIRQLFFDVVQQEFGGDFNKAAEVLSIAGRARPYFAPKAVTANTLYAIIHDKSLIKYVHLEILAQYFNVPAGLLLLFTRLQSDLRDIGRGVEVESRRNDIESAVSKINLFLDAVREGKLELRVIKEIGTGGRQLSLPIWDQEDD